MKIIDGISSCKNNCSIGEYLKLKFNFPDLKENSNLIVDNPYKVGELNKAGLMLAKDYYIQDHDIVFEFVSYRPGSFNIVPMDVTIDGIEYITQGFDFTVISHAENLELKDIVYPQKISPSFLYYLGVFSFLSLFALLIILFLKRFKIKAKKTNAIYISPYEKALRKISIIEFNKTLKQNLKEYVSSVSEIVKSFIDEEYQLSILDLTTTELIYKLKNDKIFEEDKINLCKVFFKEADLIKFKESINLSEDKNFIEDAKKIIFYLKKPDLEPKVDNK